MNKLFLLAASSALLFLTGCADDLTPETTDRGPAPYSPDMNRNVPAFREPGPLGNTGRY